MRVLAAFAWVLVPLGLWLAVMMWGTPHVVWSYRFLDNGDRYNPRAHRTYTSCTYLGVQGSVTIRPLDARCPWVRMIKVNR